MEYVKLGRTGLDVSRLCLGCMTYGAPDRGRHAWTLPEEEARPLIRRAVEAGINFFDTANTYSDGSSEEIVGRALRELTRRDEVVVATKCFFPWRPGPNGGGLSRKAIFNAIDASLARLGVDHVDLLQVHRWDKGTPIEVTMEALHDVVKSGRARYIGASSMAAWQFSKALHVAERHGWTRFSTMQPHYNLIYREEERELLPLCADEGIGVIPYSPLARGLLTRAAQERSHRRDTDEVAKRLYDKTVEADAHVITRVGEVASRLGHPRAQVALAWVLSNPVVTAPIIGVSKPGHLDDAIGALSIRLSAEDKAALEEPYVAHRVTT
ncbi:MAG TPA: aldo/keto reductase [Usitatibacter sp.]|nr:aldo/keto reductase [Usitatibacter sp.]